MTDKIILTRRQPDYATLQEALRAMIQEKRENPVAGMILVPADSECANKWFESGAVVGCNHYEYSNIPTLSVDLRGCNWHYPNPAEELRLIENEDSYVDSMAERIVKATGIGSDAGWELNYDEGAATDAEESRYLSMTIVFKKESWQDAKQAFETFIRKWNGYGLKTQFDKNEEICCIEAMFSLHPKGGSFLKQRKLQMENKQRIAELREFLLALDPYLREF